MAVGQQKKPWLWGRLSPLGLSVAILVVAVDQLHKSWMLAVYEIQKKGEVAITPFLDLVFVKNPGISYGLFAMDNPRWQWLWASFAGLAIVAMAVWLARGVTTKLVAAGLGLVMGGAASNAVDRLAIGGVADFFRLHAFGYQWYVFNLADAAIVAGVIGLLYDSLGPSRNDASKAI
jgi:signal peptidase II